MPTAWVAGNKWPPFFFGSSFRQHRFEYAGINTILNGEEATVEKEIAYSKGIHEVPLALNVSPVPDDKKQCAGAVVILRDQTEIKRLQEEERRSERLAAIGELAAGVAHEVRNPLSSIRGFAQFLGHFLKDKPEEREYAEIKAMIMRTLRETDGNRTRAADILGISRRTLRLKLKEYGVN